MRVIVLFAYARVHLLPKASISLMHVIQCYKQGCTDNASYFSSRRLSLEVFSKVHRTTSLTPFKLWEQVLIRPTPYHSVSFHVEYHIEAEKGSTPIVTSSNNLVRDDIVVEIRSFWCTETLRGCGEVGERATWWRFLACPATKFYCQSDTHPPAPWWSKRTIIVFQQGNS